MGQYFKIVNPAKRQYVDASRFGENVKASGLFYGYHAVAVALLVCNVEQVRNDRGRPVHDFGELAGSWCGDRVIVAGDDHGRPDEFGIKTSTERNPDRNLYWLAKEEFEDISYRAIAMLCRVREAAAAEMARRAAESVADGNLVHLGNVVFYVGCEPLALALAEAYGDEWVIRYKKAWPKHPN